MTVAYLGLGANLGEAQQTLKNAVIGIAQPLYLTVLAKSSVYRSQPIDAAGNDYYNCVIKIETALPPRRLLTLCHSTENQFGRTRSYRNAPRTLDIDLLLYGNLCINEPDLIVPHPRLVNRAFALMPLIELQADIEIPLHGAASKFLAAIANQRIEILKGSPWD